MKEQNYEHHAKFVPMFHAVTFPILALTLIGAGVNLYKSLGDHSRLYSASLIFVLTFCVVMVFFFSRIFALAAQDRAIRAEENLRHFILTGKLMPPTLTLKQIVGLRFAPDDEFPSLVARAAAENMEQDAIKRAVKNWKADHQRL